MSSEKQYNILSVKGNCDPLKGADYKLCCCVEKLAGTSFYATSVFSTRNV
jgi:hypothetical protein